MYKKNTTVLSSNSFFAVCNRIIVTRWKLLYLHLYIHIYVNIHIYIYIYLLFYSADPFNRNPNGSTNVPNQEPHSILIYTHTYIFAPLNSTDYRSDYSPLCYTRAIKYILFRLYSLKKPRLFCIFFFLSFIYVSHQTAIHKPLYITSR